MDKLYMTTKELMEVFGVTRQTIWNWRKAGLPFIKLSPAKICYKIEDLEEFFGTDLEELRKYL